MNVSSDAHLDAETVESYSDADPFAPGVQHDGGSGVPIGVIPNELIVLEDPAMGDLPYVIAYGDPSGAFALSDLVSLKSRDGREWIGIIADYNRNRSALGGDTLAPIKRAAYVAQADRGGGLAMVAAQTIRLWPIRLLGTWENNELGEHYERPDAGTRVRPLERTREQAVLGLVDIAKHKDDSKNVIGGIRRADHMIGLPITLDQLLSHTSLLGTTGYGKSNTLANLVHQVTAYGGVAILHDVKPDFPYITKPNSDVRSSVARGWKMFSEFGLKPRGAGSLTNVQFFRGSGRRYPNGSVVIGAWASDVTPAVLGGLFFSRQDREGSQNLAAQKFDSIAEQLRNDWLDHGRRYNTHDHYTVSDILDAARRERDALPQSDPSRATLNSLIAKVQDRRQRRRLVWLDSIDQGLDRGGVAPKPDPFAARVPAQRVERLDLDQLARRGGVVRIDYGRADDATFAVQLQAVLLAAERYRRRRHGPDDPVALVHLIDEVHRVLRNQSNQSAALATTVGRMLAEGRSLGLGFVLSLQNASVLPSEFDGLINTVIAFKHMSDKEARQATQAFGTSNFMDQLARLTRGRALVKVGDMPTPMLAIMAPSPYELARLDNEKLRDELYGPTDDEDGDDDD